MNTSNGYLDARSTAWSSCLSGTCAKSHKNSQVSGSRWTRTCNIARATTGKRAVRLLHLVAAHVDYSDRSGCFLPPSPPKYRKTMETELVSHGRSMVGHFSKECISKIKAAHNA